MNQKLLTIGVPAYNRREALLAVLDDMVRSGLHLIDTVQILVIDDDSPDGTYDAIKHLDGNGNFRILKNAERAGFRGNFCKLIEHCETEYLLYTCDDDFVLREGVERLLAYLAVETSPPALISSLFYDKGEVYRGYADKVVPIDVSHYRVCCAHMPGLVVNARLSKVVLGRVSSFLLDPRNAYPQCCLALVLLLLGYRGLYLPIELVRTGFDLESGIAGYSTVAQRWQQYLFFVDFLEFLSTHLDQPRIAELARQLLEAHKQSLFTTLGNGVSNEKPELVAYFLDGARRFIADGRQE